MKSYVTFDHIYFIKIEKKQRSERYLHTFFGLECDEILECSTLLTDQQSLTNIGLDMLMVMKVTLLVTELFFVFLLSWISYLKSTWALHQIKGGRSMEMFKPARCGVLDIFSELFE